MASDIAWAIIGSIWLIILLIALYRFFSRRLPWEKTGWWGFLRNLGALFMATTFSIIYILYTLIVPNPNNTH